MCVLSVVLVGVFGNVGRWKILGVIRLMLQLSVLIYLMNWLIMVLLWKVWLCCGMIYLILSFCIICVYSWYMWLLFMQWWWKGVISGRCVLKFFMGLVVILVCIIEVFRLFENRMCDIGLQNWKLFFECRKCVGIVNRCDCFSGIVMFVFGIGMMWFLVLLMLQKCGRKCFYMWEIRMLQFEFVSYCFVEVMMLGFVCEVSMQLSCLGGKYWFIVKNSVLQVI